MGSKLFTCQTQTFLLINYTKLKRTDFDDIKLLTIIKIQWCQKSIQIYYNSYKYQSHTKTEHCKFISLRNIQENVLNNIFKSDQTDLFLILFIYLYILERGRASTSQHKPIGVGEGQRERERKNLWQVPCLVWSLTTLKA